LVFDRDRGLVFEKDIVGRCVYGGRKRGCYFYFRWRGWKRSGYKRMMRGKRKIYLYLD
jgi:hypothetical protein